MSAFYLYKCDTNSYVVCDGIPENDFALLIKEALQG